MDRWTPETEKLVRLAISDPGAFLPRGDAYQESIPGWGARAALKALADAWLLTPPGEVVEECNVEYRRIGVLRGGVSERTYQNRTAEWLATEFESARELGQELVSRRDRTVTTWPDGSVLTSEWRDIITPSAFCPDPANHATFYRTSESRLLLTPSVRDEEEREAVAAKVCIYCGKRLP